MARKNRVTVPDGIYHVTSRICNKAMLFRSRAVKERIQKWIYDIAYFSGVEIYAWCIMDNHLHLLVHVPRVPKRLWTDTAREPDSWAFGMRPPECFPPLWQDGQKLSQYKIDALRPEVGFMLDDNEMLNRLASLYSKKSAAEIAARWTDLRGKGRGMEVDLEKLKYCRRMYNVSQFIKTLKERIAMRFNTEFNHEGCLWQGRFYSGIVEDCREVLSVVAGYIDYNPVKAKLVSSPEAWGYNSWSVALGSSCVAEQCRYMYCKMLGCGWLEAKMIMESVFNDSLPEGISPDDVKSYYDKYNEDSRGDLVDGECGNSSCAYRRPLLRASQAIRCGMWFFKKGGYIGRTTEFAERSVRHLCIGYPRVGFKSIKRCRAFIWCIPNINHTNDVSIGAAA